MGCLLRGLAATPHELKVAGLILGTGAGSMWTIVGAYLAANADAPRRALVVSGFIVQCEVCRIAGKALFPALLEKGERGALPCSSRAVDLVFTAPCTLRVPPEAARPHIRSSDDY